VVLALHSGDILAQRSVGCFVNGQQVADSMCQPGAASSSMGSPAAAVMGTMSNALGTALGNMLRNSMTHNADNAAEQAARQRAAEQEARQQAAQRQAALQAKAAEERREQEAEAQRRRDFADGQQQLLEGVRSLGAQSDESALAPRQLGTEGSPRQSLSDLAKETQSEDLRDAPSSDLKKKQKTKPSPPTPPQVGASTQPARSPATVPGECVESGQVFDANGAPIGHFYQCWPKQQDKYCLQTAASGDLEQVPCNTASR
jgi:hypothetical protein